MNDVSSLEVASKVGIKGSNSMANQLTTEVVSHPHFADLTVVTGDDGQTWFIANEVAKNLGYQKPRNAIASHVDDEDKGALKRSTLGGEQTVTTINESGLYSLIFASKLDKAKAFKRWVTSEVLPSIRKHGKYEAQQQHVKQLEYIEAVKDKVEFAETVCSSKSGMHIGEFAKSLGIGQNKLFSWLRSNKIFMTDRVSKYSRIHNMPYQNYIQAGYFTVRRTVFNTSHGRERGHTPLITGKGEVWLHRKLIQSGLLPPAN